jgi:hypothetical protein
MADEQTPQGGNPKTFTQDELDGIVKDRLDRERKKFGDYESLKEKASKLDELESASKSELQKLADRLANLEKAGSDKDATISALQGELAGERRRAKVGAVAQSVGALDASDANILQATAEVDVADPKAEELIKGILEKLRESKPYLFKPQEQTGQQPPPGRGPLASFNPAGGPGAAMTDQQILKDLLSKTGQGNWGPLR